MVKPFKLNTAEEKVRAELLLKCEPRLRRLAEMVRERVAPAEL
jgi:hypothetical protein